MEKEKRQDPLAGIDLSCITRRLWDGSFVVNNEGLPFHVPNCGSYAELWGELSRYVALHPENVTDEALMEEQEPGEEARIALLLEEQQARLKETDWYVVRFVDNGVEIPLAVKKMRQAAREEIDRLRLQRSALIKEQA